MRHFRVFAACAATWSAATRAGDTARLGRHPGRVHRRQPRRELGIHPQARLDVETGAGLDDLVRRGHRQVPREHEVPHRREPLTQRRTERGLATRQPLGHPGRQAHLRRGHRIHVPDRVDPLPRTRLPHRGLHPSTPRPRHGLRALGRVHDALQLTGELERLHGIEPPAGLDQLATHRRAPLTQCRDAAAELAPVHASSYRTPVRQHKTRSTPVHLQQNHFARRARSDTFVESGTPADAPAGGAAARYRRAPNAMRRGSRRRPTSSGAPEGPS